MARGILAGVATGLVLSVGAAAGLSLFMGYPPPPAGVLPEPDVGDADVTGSQAPDTGTAEGPGTTANPAPAPEAQGRVGGLDAPAPDAPISDATDRAPAAQPEVAGAGAEMSTPDASTSAGAIAVSPDAPVSDAPGTASPVAPSAEAALSISTDPAQPPQPDLPSEESAFTPDAPQPETADGPDGTDAPAGEEAGAPAATDASEQPTEDATDQAETDASEGPESGPDVGDDVATLSPPAPDIGAEGPGIGVPTVPLTERTDTARSTRLPTIGAAPEDTPEDAPESAADPDEAVGDDASPFRRFAAEVDAAPGTPRMAVVLIDDGSGPLGPAALDAFPFPVSFAVDPASPDAAARMAGYREKGFEVLALMDLPGSARPADIEVAFEVALSQLPEVVGVLEAPGGGLQGARARSEQVAAYLRDSGHGLVLQGQGLNTGTSLAQREGVPAGAIFRDIDGEDQDPGMQRRLLDRVALRARQDGSAIVLGRLRADTVSALLLWGLQDRTNALALVPVSGVIGMD